MTVCSILKNESFLYESPDHGRSEQATSISEYLYKIRSDFFGIITTMDHRQQMLGAMEIAARESSADNWDGYGAKAVSPTSYKMASDFAAMLPMSIPLPDVCVDPDGMIEFEWYRGPRRVLSVTVEATGKLIYAGLFGQNKAHGTEMFDESVPQVVFENLQRLFSES